MSSLMSSAGSSEDGSRSLNQRKKLATSSWPLFRPFTSAAVFSVISCQERKRDGRVSEEEGGKEMRERGTREGE